MMRRRGGKPGNADSSSLSSSDSDGKRKNKTPKKKACKPKGSKFFPCLFVTDRVNSCVGRMRCGMSCLTSRNTRCFLLYGFILLLPIFLYFYGAYLWGMLKYVFSLSIFKTTSAIVTEALAKYNADKLGLADYALESAGGSILCSSDTYYARSGALYSIFSIPLWYHSSSPREVIQPDVLPGKCWAMDGDKGYVMIKLSMPVVVTAVSLEHIPAQVAPTGRLDSAPKDFLIVGKETSMESPDIILGGFAFHADTGHSIQTFHLKDPYCTRHTENHFQCGPNQQVFRIIELRILSNHGNKDYTCIYRLRVHGRPLQGFPGHPTERALENKP